MKGGSSLTGTNDSVYVCGTPHSTITCPITKSSGSGWMSFYVNADSMLSVLGDITASGGLSIIGNVRFGGTITTTSFYIYGARSNSRATVATFLPGSKMTCSNMANDNLGGSLVIRKSAEVIFKKGRWKANDDKQNYVDGTFDIQAGTKYSGKGAQRYDGTGLLCIAMPVSHSGGDGTTFLGTGITLRPGARWNTVTSEAADKYVRLGVESFGTISITNDFSYGPAVGLETTTTAADRALQLPRPACTLTVDTQDPVTGEGHTATFEDPIIGYGKLVKRGAGTLVFASSENAITGGVEIAEGAFTWTEPQTLQKLSFGAGAKIVFPASAPSLTVENGLDLTGAVIDLSAIPPVSLAGWTEVIGTDAGGISGEPAFSVPDRFRYRVVENGSGGASLEVRCRLGSQFTIR
jgi:autotransporter-associated beta strand protein